MQIKGYQKTTLLDYPDKVASLVFTGGCNFRCPYCHNAELVLHPYKFPIIMEDVVLEHLRKRKGIIDGVVITGGEPTLMKGLIPFIGRLKEEGVLVKLDTNGYRPEVLRDIIGMNLVDYIAMDVKATCSKYSAVAGVESLDMLKIIESIGLIIKSGLNHEFRTTVSKEHHGFVDVLEIGQLIKGANRWAIQQYMASDEQLVNKDFGAYDRDEMLHIKALVEANCDIGEVIIRGKY